MTGERVGRYTVIYDGNCGVCSRLVKRLAALDKRGVFELVASQQPGARERFPWIPAQAYAESLQLVRSGDNQTWQGAAAVEQIISRLRVGWVVSWMFAIPFGRRVADRLYRWFADHRQELGCGDHCRVQATPPDAAE